MDNGLEFYMKLGTSKSVGSLKTSSIASKKASSSPQPLRTPEINNNNNNNGALLSMTRY